MKNFTNIIFFLFISLSLTSCVYWGNNNDDDLRPVDKYKPVVVTRTELENSVASKPSQNTNVAGKLYIKDNLMFLNDKNSGFHVFNYTDPLNPIKIGFISVLGATDLSIRNNLLYINQAVDLLTLEYFPINNSIIIKHRNKNVFPQKKSPFGRVGSYDLDKIIVDWKL